MDCEQTGINYAAQLSYAAIDASELKQEQKRRLLIAVYAFRRVFDEGKPNDSDPVLKKYGVTDEVATSAEKPSLYETALTLSSLKNASAELKAMLYLTFPYVMLIGAPHETETYYKLKDALAVPEIFDAALGTRYSAGTPDSLGELRAMEIPNIVIDWLLPYIEYKNEKNEKGVSRDVERYQKWLAAGRFAEVLAGTEKLLDTFPDDDTLLLTNIAARISLDTVKNPTEREKLLLDTINMIESVLSEPNEKKAFFLYYHALALIGLKRIDEANEKLGEVLETSPGFEPAVVMQRAIAAAVNK